jgi:probable F420-dependent oxidoreductase
VIRTPEARGAGGPSVTFGVLPGGSSPQEFLAAAQTAEALGYDSVWVGDHVLWPAFWPEPLTMLAAASAVTDRVGLGTGVLLAALRKPAALAKQTATLQWLAEGRFRLGVGAGGEYPTEFAASGVPLDRRGPYLDQTLEALRALWTGAPVTLANEVVQLDGAVLDVVPDPPIPIWVGGRSTPAQRRAARFGDAWMPFVITPERFAEGWANVRGQAEALGRDPDVLLPALQLWGQFDDDFPAALETIAARIEQTNRTPFERFERYTVYGDAAMWIDRLGAFLDAGVRHFNLVFAGGDRLAQLARVAAEVVPAVEARAE